MNHDRARSLPPPGSNSTAGSADGLAQFAREEASPHPPEHDTRSALDGFLSEADIASARASLLPARSRSEPIAHDRGAFSFTRIALAAGIGAAFIAVWQFSSSRPSVVVRETIESARPVSESPAAPAVQPPAPAPVSEEAPLLEAARNRPEPVKSVSPPPADAPRPAQPSTEIATRASAPRPEVPAASTPPPARSAGFVLPDDSHLQVPVPVDTTVELQKPVTPPPSPRPLVAPPRPAPAPAVREDEAGTTRAAVAPAVRRNDEESAVRAVLSQYQSAFERLDAGSAKVVWPTVDERALTRAFQSLLSQDLRFDECRLFVTGPDAVASCNGAARYVRRVGNRSAQEEPRQWTFVLKKDENVWRIETVDTR